MIYVLDRFAKDVVAVLSNESPAACPFWSDAHTEQLDTAYLSYEFTCPADHASIEFVRAENHIIIKDLDGKFILFQIKTVIDDIQNGQHVKSVHAENAAVGDLYGSIIRPTTQNGVTAQQALAYALQGTPWIVGAVEWEGIQTFDWLGYPTALAALQEIGQKFTGELRFTVDFKNGEVKSKVVDLVKRGQDSGVRFDYAVNMQGIKRTEDSSELVTALIGVGKADDKGVRMTISSAGWAAENGHPAKPIGQDFIADEDALQKWGKNGQHIIGVYEDNEAAAPNTLLTNTWEELKKRNKPKLTYELTAVLLERLTGYEHTKVRLGDTVVVKDMSFVPYLTISARVIEIVRSYADPMQDRVTLGEFKPLIVDQNALVRQLSSLVYRKEGVWETAGGDAIYKSTTAPTAPTTDMLWLDTSTVPNVLKRYDGTDWKKASPTQASEIGAETPGGAQSKADAAQSQAITVAQLDAIARANAAQSSAEWYTAAKNGVNLLKNVDSLKVSSGYEWVTDVTGPDGMKVTALKKYVPAGNGKSFDKVIFPTIAVNPRKAYLLEVFVKPMDSNSKYSFGFEDFTATGADTYAGDGPLFFSSVVPAAGTAGTWIKLFAIVSPHYAGADNSSDTAEQSTYTPGTDRKFYNATSGLLSPKIYLTNDSDTTVDSTMYATRFGVYEIGSGDALNISMQEKADAAIVAAGAVAKAETALAEARAAAYADGKVTAEEQARINQAQANLDAAKADAQTKADAAKSAAITTAATDATGKANSAETNAKGYTDDNTGNLVNNPAKSGTLAKWSFYDTATIDQQILSGDYINAIKLPTATDAEVYSDPFKVDPSKGYEITAWIRQDVNTAGYTYFGCSALNADGTKVYVTEVNLADAGTRATIYPRFYSGNVEPLGQYKKFVGFVFPYGTDPNTIKGLGLNVQKAFILPANATKMYITFLNYDNANAATKTIWVTQINAQELGSTQAVIKHGQVAYNFDTRNDRKSTLPATPTIATDGSSVDHTINSDGSANLSFEWAFTGSGDAYDIDGFFVYVRSSTAGGAYTMGNAPAEENVYAVAADKRAAFLYGVPSTGFYTFGIQAFRYVDNDIAASGVLKSGIAQPQGPWEEPYQPNTSPVFSGDVTGTVNGVAANLIETTTEAQAKADAAKNAAISAAANDATTKANNAETNAKNAVANGQVGLPTSALQGAIDAATTALKQGSNMVWDAGGLVMIDPNNSNNRVRITSSGIGVSTNGGQTYQTAMTGAGVVADTIVGNTISGVMLSGVTVTTDKDLSVGDNIKMGYGKPNAKRTISFNDNPDVNISGGTGPNFSSIGISGNTLELSTPEMNLYGYQNIKNNSKASATIGSAQTLSSGVWTRVAFDSVFSDQFGEFSTGSNRFTSQHAGHYLIDLGVQFQLPSSAGITLAISIYKNGVEYARVYQATDVTNNVQAHGPVIALDTNYNDYFEAYAYTSASGVILTNNASLSYMKFWKLG